MKTVLLIAILALVSAADPVVPKTFFSDGAGKKVSLFTDAAASKPFTGNYVLRFEHDSTNKQVRYVLDTKTTPADDCDLGSALIPLLGQTNTKNGAGADGSLLLKLTVTRASKDKVATLAHELQVSAKLDGSSPVKATDAAGKVGFVEGKAGTPEAL